MGKMNVKLCITLVGPLAGVLFCRAKGSGAKTEFIDATVSNGQDLSFTFEVAVKKVTSAEIPDFGGAFVQGKAGARFVYLNIGQYAGQTDSPWKRRVKVGLTGISHTMLWPQQVMTAAVSGLLTPPPRMMEDLRALPYRCWTRLDGWIAKRR